MYFENEQTIKYVVSNGRPMDLPFSRTETKTTIVVFRTVCPAAGDYKKQKRERLFVG